MISVPAASQPTVASSAKLGIRVFCAAAAGHNSMAVPKRAANNPPARFETVANLAISEIRSARRRNRFDVETEEARAAFGAGGFGHRSLRHAAPGLDQFQRLFERRR